MTLAELRIKLVDLTLKYGMFALNLRNDLKSISLGTAPEGYTDDQLATIQVLKFHPSSLLRFCLDVRLQNLSDEELQKLGRAPLIVRDGILSSLNCPPFEEKFPEYFPNEYKQCADFLRMVANYPEGRPVQSLFEARQHVDGVVENLARPTESDSELYKKLYRSAHLRNAIRNDVKSISSDTAPEGYTEDQFATIQVLKFHPSSLLRFCLDVRLQNLSDEERQEMGREPLIVRDGILSSLNCPPFEEKFPEYFPNQYKQCADFLRMIANHPEGRPVQLLFEARQDIDGVVENLPFPTESDSELYKKLYWTAHQMNALQRLHHHINMVEYADFNGFAIQYGE